MKYLIYVIPFFFFMCGIVAKSETPKGIQEPEEDFATKEIRESLQRYVETLKVIETMPPDEAIPKLGEMMVRTFRWQDDESMTVYKSAQQKLISIPDHAKHFTDKIEEVYELQAEKIRTIEYPPDWDKRVIKMVETRGFEFYQDWLRGSWGNYEESRSECLGMLGHIPSTESVRALGHYLRERDEPKIKIPWPKTGNVAAESLTEMIADGPTQIWMASWEDVPKWQQWFDEVKAGNRTFRFVGSNVEYTLDGPADARTLERIKNKNSNGLHSGGRREHITAPEDQTRPSKMGPIFQSGLIASIVLCLVALIFLLKRRNVA